MSRLCCIHCGKDYKLRINLDKHFVLCEIIHKAKNKDKNKDRETEEINEDLPSQKRINE